jgi:hypothetical protein
VLTAETSSIVIAHLESLREGSERSICVCYIFFRYSDRSELTVRAVLEILVMQTLERHPECQSIVEQTYSKHLGERTEPTEKQLMSLLRQLVAAMSVTFYVLDALDEAPAKIQLAVLRALTSLNVKLFITSRPLEPLEARFPQAHIVAIFAQDEDLEIHIAKGIEESVELRDLLEADPLLREELVSTVKKNCGGM